MMAGLKLPDGLTPDDFMRDYWQKRPLLMRRALDPSLFRLAPEDLAGLACEDDVESRLIEGSGHDWSVRHGPFDDADFARLDAAHWTLLVQDVDKLVDDVAELLDHFEFVPAWRIDDIMVSYASDGGGVGPHSDAYDVFLMQGHGNRRWQLSHGDYGEKDLLPGLEQRILSHFQIDEEWLLQPGDVLYLPPGIAHWGTAEGPCMTYSLGFRAPAQRELAADWYQWLVEQADESRLTDPADSSGAKIPAALQDEAAAVIDALPGTDSDAFRRWLGEYFTGPKPQFELLPIDAPSLDDFAEMLDAQITAGEGMRRHPFARLAWSPMPRGGIWIFCQGRCLEFHDLDTRSADLICRRRLLDGATIDAVRQRDPGVVPLLHALFCEGALETADEEAT